MLTTVEWLSLIDTLKLVFISVFFSRLHLADFSTENHSWVIQAHILPRLSTATPHGLPPRCHSVNKLAAIKITAVTLSLRASSLRWKNGQLVLAMGIVQAAESTATRLCGPKYPFA